MTDDANDALPEPGAPEPATGAAEVETPTETTPTVEAPAAAADTTEVPTVATAPPPAVQPAAPGVAEPARRSGITVPTWVAALIGAAIVFALGFGIGYGVGDDGDGDGGSRSVQAGPGAGFGFNGRMPDGGQMPFGGPFGNGSGGSNGGNGQMPFGRNGNGGNNGGGNNGGPATANVFLGVAAQDSTDPDGAELARVVAGSPAADAGLKAGDVITEFDGTTISSASDLTAAVRSQEAGDTVTITYTRDGRSDTTEATLAGSSDFSRQ